MFAFDEYGPTRMIRSRNWKYVHRYAEGEPNELYDLAADAGEARNLAGDLAHAEREAALRAELQGWFGRYADEVMDGSRQRVFGRGQVGLVGSDDYPKPFADDVAFFGES